MIPSGKKVSYIHAKEARSSRLIVHLIRRVAPIVRKYSFNSERKRGEPLPFIFKENSVWALVKFIPRYVETYGRFGALHARESDCLNALSIFPNQEILQREWMHDSRPFSNNLRHLVLTQRAPWVICTAVATNLFESVRERKRKREWACECEGDNHG